jgi:hypothetical protein
MKNTNGNLPAMPTTIFQQIGDIAECHSAGGFTKREQFAMAAMQGILSNSNNGMSHCARDAVMMADELLAELERTA